MATVCIFSVSIDAINRDNFDFLTTVKNCFGAEFCAWLSTVNYTIKMYDNLVTYETVVSCWINPRDATFYFLKFADHR
jgi:hypothetical protein